MRALEEELAFALTRPELVALEAEMAARVQDLEQRLRTAVGAAVDVVADGRKDQLQVSWEAEEVYTMVT